MKAERDPAEPTNAERAQRGWEALARYGRAVGEDESNLTDLLADLMHHCCSADAGCDFNTELERARRNFDTEIAEAGGDPWAETRRAADELTDQDRADNVEECINCGVPWRENELDPYEDVDDLSPGDIVPLGRCPDPECGAAVFLR